MSKRIRLQWFFNGIARLFDWQGTMNTTYYLSPRPKSAKEALAQDWDRVGDYFDAVIGHRRDQD